MSDDQSRPPAPSQHPRYPGTHDPQATPPTASSPGAAPAHAVSPRGSLVLSPLGALTPLTIALAVVATLLLLPRPWLAFDAERRWLQMDEDGLSAFDSITPYEIYAFVPYLALVGGYIVTCLFLWRARVAVDQLSPRSPQARRKGWIWAGWLVPVVSLWFPFQVVRDALRVRSHHPSAGSTVGWWWGAFLVFLISWQVEGRAVPWDDIDPSTISLLPPLSIVTTVAGVAACVLWVRVVRAIAADQAELLAAARA